MPADTNDSSARTARVNEAIAAYLEAADAGKTPSAEDFIAEHRDIATELTSFLANSKHFERWFASFPSASNVSIEQANEAHLPSSNEPSSKTVAAPTEMTSRYFGDYELLEEIARGGMGVVYLAGIGGGRNGSVCHFNILGLT